MIVLCNIERGIKIRKEWSDIKLFFQRESRCQIKEKLNNTLQFSGDHYKCHDIQNSGTICYAFIMNSAHAISLLLIEEGISARAHFQIWWALRNLALPKYLPAMNDLNYVDFFHASSSGHYKLFFLALSKIFDRDSRVAGISEFKNTLCAEGHERIALRITQELKPIEPLVEKLMHIRNKTIVHNEHSIPRAKVYRINGITPNQLRQIIDTVCVTISAAAQDLGIANTIFDSDRFESATLNMLERLKGEHA